MTPDGAISDVSMLNTPSKTSNKGKHKEDDHWQLGWWDFVPLVEGRRQPIQWTSSSTLMTAHATQAQLVCIHFPSSKQFTLSPPPPLSTAPESYQPATVISASPRGDWLFAYFPGSDADGVGCLWRRGPQVDSWAVKEWWTVARGAGVVQARWLGADREWVMSEDGVPTRLPFVGPSILYTNPVLLLVTQAHIVNVYYAHAQTDAVKLLSASLCRPCTVKDGETRIANERVDGPRGMGVVTHAAIGLGYNESSIIVATHSKAIPASTSDAYANANSTDNLSLSLDMSPASEPALSSEWEVWDDDHTLNLCEIRIALHELALTLSTTPLPPIHTPTDPMTYLTDLAFVPAPSARPSDAPFPSTPTPAHRTTPTHSRTHSSSQIRHSPGKGSPPKIRGDRRVDGKSQLFLVCSFINFGDAAQPKSELLLYSFLRRPNWTHNLDATRSLPPGIVAFLSPAAPASSYADSAILAAVLNIDRATRISSGKEAVVGRIHAVSLPSLQYSEKWEPSNIVSPVNAHGIDLPFNAAVSPNYAMICTVSSSTTLARTTINPYPARRPTDLVPSLFGGPMSVSRNHISRSLAMAVHKRTTTNDITHALALATIPVAHVEETLDGTLQILERNSHGLRDIWVADLVGVAVEVYRSKSDKTVLDADKEDLTARQLTAQDIIYMAACNLAWEDCIDGEGYDLGAVWQLVGISGWYIDFLERLLRECVLSLDCDGEAVLHSEKVPTIQSPKKEEDIFSPISPRASTMLSPSSPASSMLLHLVHPYTLENLHRVLTHVKRFRGYLGSLSASGESSQIAKEVLVDMIDCSGINLDALIKTISDFSPDVKSIPVAEARRNLASMRPCPGTDQLLHKIVSKVTESQVVNRVRLFVKPADLVDGMLGLNLAGHRKESDRDIVSKGILPKQLAPRVCFRCGGKSEFGFSGSPAKANGHVSRRWNCWERSWIFNCVCGGLWGNG